ncbi:MAG: DUF4390 domain-containing protein [Gammaproteobacteria bacterium]|nr:DUF4390 domain-containing protein [Gammaproteobacteria bacterium]
MRLLSLPSFLFIFSIALCCTSAWAEKGIRVNDLSSSVVDKKIRVDCEIHYGLSDKVKEALRNGIEMSFLLEVELRQESLYWLDPLVNNLFREFRVKYHALSKQFVMIEMGSHKERSFPDLYSAFYYQRKIHNAELASIDSLDVKHEYYIRARARLLSEKLPLPLRIKSYVSSSWRPSSGWTVWPM